MSAGRCVLECEGLPSLFISRCVALDAKPAVLKSGGKLANRYLVARTAKRCHRFGSTASRCGCVLIYGNPGWAATLGCGVQPLRGC